MTATNTSLNDKISQINAEILGHKEPLSFKFKRPFSFNIEQVYPASSWYAATYLGAKSMAKDASSTSATSILAVARYQWVLEHSAESLSNLFTEDDVLTLLDCFLDTTFFPDQLPLMASELCCHLDISICDYESSGMGDLINKLRGLSPIQSAVLAEALEHAWLAYSKCDQSMTEVFAARGIQLL